MSNKSPKHTKIRESYISVSNASSLLRASSLQFQKIYNRHMHAKAKLKEKNRRMQMNRSQDERMANIILNKEKMKSSILNYQDDSGRILRDQTTNNNQLRQKRQESIKASQMELVHRNQDRALLIKQQLKQLHIKKKLTKQNQQIESFIKRKDIYEQYFQAIQSRNNKNQLYRQHIKDQNKRDIQKMLAKKKEFDALGKIYKKKQNITKKKIQQMETQR